MKLKMQGKGDRYGSHRVLTPKGVLPQLAEKLNNDMSLFWDNELMIDVEALNIDSASFTQIKQEAGGDEAKIREIILRTVERRGKMHNPVTGSGGMLIGTVAAIGPRFNGTVPVSIGDRIATLVSLSLTPLRIDKITAVNIAIDRVEILGKAILFNSGLYAKLPDDLPATLALAVLDVAGAPAQTARLVKAGETVLIIGASGKSGILCAYEARKMAGSTGMVIGMAPPGDKGIDRLESLGLCDTILQLDAKDPLACLSQVSALTNGRLADLVINCVNIADTETASILCCRERGTVYFFSMATSFTKAALGAEGVGKDINMIIGNGYAEGHAELALNILRESEPIKTLYTELYG